MTQNKNAMRDSIAHYLPLAFETALASYQGFCEEQATAPEGMKTGEFKAHHDACKVAIAHIQLLIKLAEWADLPDPAMEDAKAQDGLRDIIERARAEIADS